MAWQSIILTFDGTMFPSGQATATNEGMAIKVVVADEILEDGLDLNYEVIGGTKAARRAWVKEVEARFDGTLKVTQDRKDLLRGVACFNNLDAISKHPVHRLLLTKRYDMDRIAMVYESGTCIIRIDFPEETPLAELEKHRLALKAECEKVGINASARLGELDRTFEDWKPLS